MKHFPDEIFHYDVAISDGKSDDDFPKNLNLSIIEELVRLNRSTFKKKSVYDRKKSLYCRDELPFKSKVCVNITYMYQCSHDFKDKKERKNSKKYGYNQSRFKLLFYLYSMLHSLKQLKH